MEKFLFSRDNNELMNVGATAKKLVSCIDPQWDDLSSV